MHILNSFIELRSGRGHGRSTRGWTKRGSINDLKYQTRLRWSSKVSDCWLWSTKAPAFLRICLGRWNVDASRSGTLASRTSSLMAGM